MSRHGERWWRPFSFPGVRAIPVIVSRLRTVFDVNADIGRIGEHLARDPSLAALIARAAGLAFAPADGAALNSPRGPSSGQQISVGRGAPAGGS